ncbi:relaxase MobL [Bacillus thuringiensis]|nr:relaxase MobL [Bacillus thuringiensis]
MGITESNLKWIAAFHEEKGHPHVHLMMWEKETKRERGALSKGNIEM